jgi:hypothetical protein
MYEMWLQATMLGPVFGIRSSSSKRQSNQNEIGGRATARQI